jgi:hypothetical protein
MKGMKSWKLFVIPPQAVPRWSSSSEHPAAAFWSRTSPPGTSDMTDKVTVTANETSAMGVEVQCLDY